MAFRNIQVDVDDAVFQAALNRATSEGKAIGQVIAGFLEQYAEGASTGSPTTYTVQRGDTLGKIAKRVYGDPYKYPLIQQANNITNPSRIWVGQVLIIPPLAVVVAQPVATTPAPAPVTTTPAPPPPPTPVVPTRPSVPETPKSPPVPSGGPIAKPAVQWTGSPNYNQRRRTNDITALIIHSTANSTLSGVISWFNNPNANVSAHYSIGKDGKIAQHVKDRNRAWHAGKSVWRGRNSCNDYTIGIELVNLNNGQDPYPETQHRANVALSAYICDKYKIKTDDITGHLNVALPPGRKSDPRGYDLARLRRDVAAVLRN